MSLCTQIAEAVASELNRHVTTHSFKAVYTVNPEFEVSQLDTLRVVVVPKTLEVSRVSRTSTKYTVSVDVGVLQRIGKMTPHEAVARFGVLVEKIAETLGENELDDFPEASFAGVAVDPIYSPTHLTGSRTFLSVLTAKYVFLG